MSRESRQEREKRLAEALRRNLGRRKQAARQAGPDNTKAGNSAENDENPARDED